MGQDFTLPQQDVVACAHLREDALTALQRMQCNGGEDKRQGRHVKDRCSTPRRDVEGPNSHCTSRYQEEAFVETLKREDCHDLIRVWDDS